ncbi:hypothetical protein EXIGLDRAFT_773842 [Exidia glandulosa HHB12029]|uniref:Heme haloperoxidase family profile domain-containing protein n=1 Tax=Exidia glandulosa HHB12029 TaxID=1314781 RepID=A0A165EM69_EXIGL|nr:hypothetical protein EXIGLDRAFT_773842 [Exidia glandulosa HHB12029]
MARQTSSALHAYNPPQFEDVRSPCPALNARANYSYIPYNGKDIAFIASVRALCEVYHLSWLLAIVLTLVGCFCSKRLAFDLRLSDTRNVWSGQQLAVIESRRAPSPGRLVEHSLVPYVSAKFGEPSYSGRRDARYILSSHAKSSPSRLKRRPILVPDPLNTAHGSRLAVAYDDRKNLYLPMHATFSSPKARLLVYGTRYLDRPHPTDARTDFVLEVAPVNMHAVVSGACYVPRRTLNLAHEQLGRTRLGEILATVLGAAQCGTSPARLGRRATPERHDSAPRRGATGAMR